VKATTSKSNVVTQILLSAVGIILGYLLLFNKSIQILTICQILCGGLVVVGVVSIVSYFLSGDYKRIDRYGFTVGTMLILSGIIGLVRINDLTANFELYGGALSLILSVLVLQGTVQMRVLDYAVWVLNLVVTLGCVAGAFCVLAGFTAVTGLVQGFASWVLLICGCASIVSLLVTWLCILLAGRRDKKLQKEKEEEAAAQAAAQAEAAAQAAQAQAEAAAQAVAQAQSASAQYQQSPYNQPSQPAEIHHAGFETASDLPPVEEPQLEFEPSGSNHTDFQP